MADANTLLPYKKVHKGHKLSSCPSGYSLNFQDTRMGLFLQSPSCPLTAKLKFADPYKRSSNLIWSNNCYLSINSKFPIHKSISATIPQSLLEVVVEIGIAKL